MFKYFHFLYYFNYPILFQLFFKCIPLKHLQTLGLLYWYTTHNPCYQMGCDCAWSLATFVARLPPLSNGSFFRAQTRLHAKKIPKLYGSPPRTRSGAYAPRSPRRRFSYNLFGFSWLSLISPRQEKPKTRNAFDIFTEVRYRILSFIHPLTCHSFVQKVTILPYLYLLSSIQ